MGDSQYFGGCRCGGGSQMWFFFIILILLFCVFSGDGGFFCKY